MFDYFGYNNDELKGNFDKNVLSFIPDGATNTEVINILELSFDYLILYREILITKFGGKGYGLLLAKSLEKKACFEKISFQIPNFLIIPTDFYNFSMNNSNIIFSEKQEKYLKKIFDSFSETSYIAIRSSADIEDAGDKNYSGVFYSGFSSSGDFKHFLEKIKKVLESSRNIKNLDVKMGIVIMEVSGINHEDGNFYPYGGGVMATTNFGDRTTISSEFGLPVGITSGKNNEVVTFDLDKEGNVIHACVKEGDSCKIGVEDEYVLNNGDIKKVHNYSPLTKIDNEGMFGIFSKDIYKKIVYIGKQLEQLFRYSLDIEFAVNNGKIYILQIRKYPNNYPRPDNMQAPEIESKEVIFNTGDIFSGLGYLNNIALHFELLKLPFIPGNSQERRTHDNRVLLDALDKLEEKYKGEGYAIYLDRLETFPSIDLKKYPGLKFVTFKSDIERYKLSHTYMILRESGVPHVIFKDNPNLVRIIRKIGKTFVYLDGNTGLYIYK